jgi:hypothetical protein
LDAAGDEAGSPDPDAAAAILTLEKSAADESAFPTTSTLRPVTPAIAAERDPLTDDADGVASAALTAEDKTDADEADGVGSTALTAGDETDAAEL